MQVLILSLAKMELKGDFLEPKVVLYSFSSGTMQIDEIRTNQFEQCTKVKLSGPD